MARFCFCFCFWIPLKMKLFTVNILNILNGNLIKTFVTIGLVGTEFKGLFAALIPSWFGILVYSVLHLRCQGMSLLLYFLIH